MRKSLTAPEKYKAVMEVISKKCGLVEVAGRYGVSRQSLYFWVKKYTANSQKGSKSLKNNYVSGNKHPKSVSWKMEKEILQLVLQDPDLGIYGLWGKLKSRGYNVSEHGIYNVLLRHELQTKELRQRYAKARPTKVVLATQIAPAVRAAIVEENIKGGKPVAEVCRNWGISRPTFYEWERRYKEGVGVGEAGTVEALARRYKRGQEHHLAISGAAREHILEVVKTNPKLSINKILAAIKKATGPVVGHHGIQNFLAREGLNTLAKRLVFVSGLAGVPTKVQVAPLYIPQVPAYSVRALIKPITGLPGQLIHNPRSGAVNAFFVIALVTGVGLWFRFVIFAPQQSPVGVLFASVALFFGFFFLIYSMKYYVSILMVLRLAQSGIRAEGAGNE